MRLAQGRFFAIMLLLLAASPPARSEPPAEKKPPPRLDRYGDPLPEGAIARLGTVRFRHGFHTHSVAFSPDGKVLASAGGGNEGVCFWDPATGRPLQRVRNPWYASSLAFSPDGKTVFTGSYLIDVATGNVVRRFKGANVGGGAFSPDGRTVAAGEFHPRGSKVTLWDVTTGQVIRQLDGHSSEVTSIAFSPDGKTLASGGEDKMVRLWDVAAGQELRRLEGHEDMVFSVAFSPGGKVLASAGKDPTIRLWNVKTGKELHRLKGHEEMVLTLAFSPDGKRLASGGHDRTIRLWDVDTGKEVRRWEAHVHMVSSVAFSPDGKTLASTGVWDQAIRLWDAATGKEIHPVVGHTGLVESLRFSPDGKTLISHGREQRIVTWDLATGVERRQLLGGPAGRWWSAADLSPDGKTLAVAAWISLPEKPDPVVRLWDTGTGKEIRALSKHRDWVRSLAFAPDGKLLASGGKDGLICLWDVATGKELRELKGHPPGVWSVAFSPDGQRLASAGDDKTICVWEVATGKELRHWDSKVETLVFSPDGKRLASSDRMMIQVWDVTTGKELGRFAGRGSTFARAFSPTGRILAASELDHKNLPSGDRIHEETIHLWELDSGQEVQRIPGNAGCVWSLAFAPDSRTLASGGGDSTILLWDLTGGGRDGRWQRARRTAEELDQLWTNLGGEAAKAYRVGWTLTAAPERALSLLRDRLRPVAAANRRRIAQLVVDLDDKQFAVRDKAAEELARIGELAEPALRKALAGKPSLELRRRAEQLLAKLDGPVTRPEALRILRAVEVLEYIGTPEAQEVLKRLATGAPEARLTQEAKAALERLAKRPAAKP